MIKVMILLFMAFVITYIFNWFPDRSANWIPFYKMEFSLKTHVYFICERLRLIIFMYCFYSIWNDWRLRAIVLMQVGFLIDYLLIYNTPITKVQFEGWYIPISYSLFYGLAFLLLLSNAIYEKWKNSVRY